MWQLTPGAGAQAFLIDLAALQEKHVKTAKLLLGEGRELNSFVSRLLDDIANLKAMLQAISIGAPAARGGRDASAQAAALCQHLLETVIRSCVARVLRTRSRRCRHSALHCQGLRPLPAWGRASGDASSQQPPAASGQDLWTCGQQPRLGFRVQCP